MADSMVSIGRATTASILAIVVLGLILAAPNLLDRETAQSLPSWMPSNQINLGLDLQGGIHQLLEVDTDGVVRERMEAVVDSLRSGLRDARVRRDGGIDILEDGVVFKVAQAADMGKAREVAREVAQANSDSNPLGFGGGPSMSVTTDDAARQVRITLAESTLQNWTQRAVAQTIEVLNRRVNMSGTTEPVIQQQGDNRIIVQLPGQQEMPPISQAKLTFQFVEGFAEPGQRRGPPGTTILESDDLGPDGRPISYVIKKRVIVSGENLVDASATFERNEPVVAFRFDTVGARKFGEATSKNVGRLFAIVLDNRVISAPRIRSAILGGSGIIEGSFTVQSARELALLLRAGALPASLKVLEERTVGPGLGADSIAAGKIACLVGLVAVIVFMIMTYGLFGVMANIALAVNLVLIAAVLSQLQATLTLPGIAGIVLTIGMAVDANVLIFERIREEMKAGRSPISAVDAGYKRARTSIFDANLTTFIAALLLWTFGSGPIRGFAVTLSIGLATSVFSAVWLTRLMVVTWLRRRRRRHEALPI